MLLALPETTSPVVSGTATATSHEHILRIPQISVPPRADPVDYAGLQINQDGARDVMLVVGLVEEDVLSVIDGCQRVLGEVL